MTIVNPALNPLDGREGAAFRNPISEGHPYYDYHAPGWGCLVSPDEQRYVTLFGNPLRANDSAQTITDEVLLYYEAEAIALLEMDFNISLLPRVVLYTDPSASGDQNDRLSLPQGATHAVPAEIQAYIDLMTEEQKYQLIIRDPGYPFQGNKAAGYLYTDFRKKPLRKLYTAKIVDPVRGLYLDILEYAKIKPGFTATGQFFPNTVSSTAWLLALGHGLTQFRYPFENFPDALLFDYTIGFEKAAAVPRELREIVRLLAGIILMNDYGDGKSAALASKSASFNSISESIATTQSATSATFGARIQQFGKQLDRIYKANIQKYSRTLIGFV